MASSWDPYRYASISQMADALRSASVSPAELASFAVDGLRSVAAPLNAVAQILEDRAKRDAGRAAHLLRSETAGPLCGIPYGAKDIFAARGGRTTWGSPFYAGQRLDKDATAVQRVSRDGAVLVAKLATVELAGAGRPARWGSSATGQGRNPWDPRRYSGGSSSGPGIAVALGVVPFAFATETGGSILAPSAFCGVTGLRPTFGRVPTGGVMTLSRSLDKVGVLARSATDCATVLATTAPRRHIATLDRVPTIGVPRGWEAGVHPAVAAAADRAISEVANGVGRVVRLDAVSNAPFDRWLETIMSVEASWQFRRELAQDAFWMTDAKALEAMRHGLEIRAADYLTARRGQNTARLWFRELFARADFILAPSQPRLPPLLDEPAGPRTSATAADLLKNAGNLAGVPAVAFPVGLSPDGLPVGMQLIGRPGADETVLEAVQTYQAQTGWHDVRPGGNGGNGVAAAEASDECARA